MLVKIPRSLNLKTTIIFVNDLYSAPDSDKYIFDFSQLDWIEPFSLLYLSFAIFGFSESHKEASLKVINFSGSYATDYAGHMGFFKAFGIDSGKFPGEAASSADYHPIEIFDIDAWRKEAAHSRKYIGEIIERHSRDLAIILTRERKGDLIDTLEFTLREIIRNVAEHSGAEQVGFCAQYWPQKNLVDLAILDSGRGFKESLAHNPYLDKEMTDQGAVNYALLPGISGKMYKGKYTDPHDEWENSGFGLFMASEICRHGGSFFVSSRSAGTLLRNDQKQSFKLHMPCTAIRLRLNTKMIQPTALLLKEYRNKGEKIAKKIYGANISASAASTMLARDFK